MESVGGALLGSAGVAVVRAVGGTIGGYPLGSAVGVVEGVFGWCLLGVGWGGGVVGVGYLWYVAE